MLHRAARSTSRSHRARTTRNTRPQYFDSTNRLRHKIRKRISPPSREMAANPTIKRSEDWRKRTGIALCESAAKLRAAMPRPGRIRQSSEAKIGGSARESLFASPQRSCGLQCRDPGESDNQAKRRLAEAHGNRT